MTPERQIRRLRVIDKRSGQRVIVELDDGETLDLDPEIVARRRLKTGATVGDELLEELKREDELLQARRRLTRYLALRVKSVAEARAYLERASFGERAIDATIEDAIDRDLLDDRRFAERFIRTRLKTSPQGPLRLLADLRAHGIDSTLAEEVLGPQFDRDWQLETAEALARKRKPRTKAGDEIAMQKRLYDLLRRRGFEEDVAHEVARRICT